MQVNIVDLVLSIKRTVHDELLECYKNAFNNPTNKDGELSDSIRFYQSLNKEQQELIFSLIENSCWNTVSSFFAWLDGVYLLDSQPEHVELKYCGDDC